MIEVYNNYSMLGINSRPITEGEEFNMVKDFIEFKKNSFKETSSRQLAVFLETKINNSYPDVLFVEYNPQGFENWNTNRQKLTRTDLKVLFYLYCRRGVTSQTIANSLSIQYKTLLSSLEALLDSDIITRKNNAWVVQDHKSIFGVRRIEAVEAKISKWNVVLQQALINQTFASESFVLSKRKNKPEASVIRRISDFGIGIYLYDEKKFSCISPARKSTFPLSYNSIYLNECIGKILL